MTLGAARLGGGGGGGVGFVYDTVFASILCRKVVGLVDPSRRRCTR